MNLIDIFRTRHPNGEEYTFFSNAHGTFSRTDHTLGPKSNFSKPNRLSLRGQGWSPVSCGDLTRGHPEVSFRADKRAAEPRVRLGRGCGAVTRGLVLGRVGGWMGRGEDLMDRGGADGPGPGVGGQGWMGWGWGQMDWGGSSMDRGGASIGWGRGLDGLGQGGWG